MPYRYVSSPGRSRSPGKYGSQGRVGKVNQGRLTNSKNYISQQNAGRRHDFTFPPKVGTSVPLGSNLYVAYDVLAFNRSFGAGTDDPPTPSASNNYQDAKVMNGSKIVNFKSKILVQNRSSNAFYLDVYECVLSFWDAFIWESVFDAACPVSMSVLAGAPAAQGNVSLKPPTVGLISEQNRKDFKFVQHYLKHIQTLNVMSENSPGGTVEYNLGDVPPKCRRSNNGMFWAIFLYNDFNKNDPAASINFDTHIETSFREIPSEDRLPYLN